nr:hypothetical protein [Tanacetum cinerariifolium]
ANKEDDMEVDIKEDENETELTYPYEEVDPLNPSPPASESEPEDVIEVEDTAELEDETVPASVHETAHALVKKKGKAKDEYYGKLILDLGNVVQSSMEERTAAMENLVRKLGNTEERAECKKLKKELEEARFSNTLLRMQNERVERDLYWTIVQAHEFYREMIRRGFMFDERPNVYLYCVITKMNPQIMPPKSAPLTQAAVRRMIKESVNAIIAAERVRHANAGNDARGSGPIRGQDAAPAVRECTFAGFMKCNPAVFCSTEGAVELRRWFEKTESGFGISECVEGKKVKFAAATLLGPSLTLWNSKGEVTSSRPTILNEAMRMAHKLMEQKSQAMNKRILEGNKRKWENFQSGNSSGKSNRKDNSHQSSQNNQKQGNARAMKTASTEGNVSSRSLPVCERCFTRHVGPCTIKCHKCGKVGHKSRYYKEKGVATGANAQLVWTCYDCSEQGHMRNRCPMKVEQEETGEVCGRAYVIEDAEPQGLNVVTGMFLLNNRYASVLFNLVSDKSFVDTRFSSMLDIDPVKIDSSYEAELADGRVVSVEN